MKKRIFIFLLLSVTVFSFAQNNEVKDKEIKEIDLSTKGLENRAKIGIALGYPTGVTFGYKLANYLETNLYVGSFFNGGVSLGGNALFTLANIKIKDQILPLSLGPTLIFDFGNQFRMSLLATLRWEYTFDEIPLNLYIEGGPGIKFINDFDFAWSSSLGVRYVF